MIYVARCRAGTERIGPRPPSHAARRPRRPGGPEFQGCDSVGFFIPRGGVPGLKSMESLSQKFGLGDS